LVDVLLSAARFCHCHCLPHAIVDLPAASDANCQPLPSGDVVTICCRTLPQLSLVGCCIVTHHSLLPAVFAISH